MTKIATRLKNAITGEEFYIGTVGIHEHVRIVLSADTAVDWTQYQVQVEDTSLQTSATYNINAEGTCEFTVTIGDEYVVILPIVGDYTQPSGIIHIATMATRVITYTYAHEYRKELVDIQVVVSAGGGGTVADLDGLLVLASDTDGGTYTIVFPTLSNYTHDNLNNTHKAGLPSRKVLVHYTQKRLGVYGLDAQGNAYSVEEIEQLQDKSIIIAGAFNSPQLDASPRGDGTYGNGFCWDVNDLHSHPRKAWASQNVLFDTERLPLYSDLGSLEFAGNHLSNIIEEIGQEIEVDTPAVSYTREYSINISGVERVGFLPAPGQIRELLSSNLVALNALYSALGKTNAITNLAYSVQVSAQYDAIKNVVATLEGNINNREKNDYNWSPCFPVFDL